jgi:hypothetical protein
MGPFRGLEADCEDPSHHVQKKSKVISPCAHCQITLMRLLETETLILCMKIFSSTTRGSVLILNATLRDEKIITLAPGMVIHD